MNGKTVRAARQAEAERAEADSEAHYEREAQQDARARIARLQADTRPRPTERATLTRLAAAKTLTKADRAELLAIERACVERGPGKVEGSLLHTFPRPRRPPPSSSVFRPRIADRSVNP